MNTQFPSYAVEHENPKKLTSALTWWFALTTLVFFVAANFMRLNYDQETSTQETAITEETSPVYEHSQEQPQEKTHIAPTNTSMGHDQEYVIGLQELRAYLDAPAQLQGTNAQLLFRFVMPQGQVYSYIMQPARHQRLIARLISAEEANRQNLSRLNPQQFLAALDSLDAELADLQAADQAFAHVPNRPVTGVARLIGFLRSKIAEQKQIAEAFRQYGREQVAEEVRQAQEQDHREEEKQDRADDDEQKSQDEEQEGNDENQDEEQVPQQGLNENQQDNSSKN